MKYKILCMSIVMSLCVQASSNVNSELEKKSQQSQEDRIKSLEEALSSLIQEFNLYRSSHRITTSVMNEAFQESQDIIIKQMNPILEKQHENDKKILKRLNNVETRLDNIESKVTMIAAEVRSLRQKVEQLIYQKSSSAEKKSDVWMSGHQFSDDEDEISTIPKKNANTAPVSRKESTSSDSLHL